MRYLTLLLLGPVFTAVCFASTIHIPSQQPTIQAGIDAVVNGDTLLVAPGTYAENIDFKGKDIMVTSSDGAAVTVIDGTLSGTVVLFLSGETASAVIQGFTITNGLAAKGGGIRCIDSSPTIHDCIITGNGTTDGDLILFSNGGPGAGIYSHSSSQPTISNCEITHNITGDGLNSSPGAGCTDGGNGAGIFCSSATISNCLISDNQTGRGGSDAENVGWPTGDGGHGGGIFCADAHIENCTIENNSTGQGGWTEYEGVKGGSGAGIYCDSLHPYITRCMIKANRTGKGGNADDCGGEGGLGGGIFSSSMAIPTIDGCIFLKNETGEGGKAYDIYVYAIAGDGGCGAGIYCFSANIISCGFFSNMAGRSAGCIGSKCM